MIQSQEVQSGMRQVDVDNIERELDNMWRQTNASALASGSHPATRNSVLTLVAFTYGEQAALVTRNAVNAMVGMHPSRSVIIAPLNSHDGPPLESYIDTGLYTSGAGASYGEQIVVLARDDAVPHLSGVVLPLIISGLPSYLWWRNDPPWRTEQLEAMVDGCDRFIVDTSEMQQPLPGLVALDDLQRRKKSASATSDFNWSRQAPWRELTAGFFDAPALRPYLQGIDRVTIEYAAGAEDSPTNPVSAYLLAGWLASRLGWLLHTGRRSHGVDAAQEHTLYNAAGQPITIEINARFGVPLKSWQELVAEEDPTPSQETQDGQDGRAPATARTKEPPCVGPGALMSLHLHARLDAAKTGIFAIAREPDMRHASTLSHVPEGAPPSQTVHLPSIGESSLLATQLQLMDHDTIFEDALTMAAELAGPAAAWRPRQ
jgi:glucose-6-phosphate dehydrogenase assembly protein OpcA